jgi:hypothetical protein
MLFYALPLNHWFDVDDALSLPLSQYFIFDFFFSKLTILIYPSSLRTLFSSLYPIRDFYGHIGSAASDQVVKGP